MNTKFYKIFKKGKNAIIGAIHLPPLLGYQKFPGFDIALKNALYDLKAFEDGGVDGIIFENNYDVPHKIFVDAPIISSMTFLGKKLRTATKLPIGINVLWNDYRAALSIAKVIHLQFIRIPVFVDKVSTDYGVIEGNPRMVLKFRESIGAEGVALFTDIHVKHAELLSKHNFVTSAKIAIKNRADAIIITGEWTGNAPSVEKVKSLREHIGNFPILVGSGVNEDNVRNLFKFANGAIVSTSLKKGLKKSGEVNVKPYKQRIDIHKVRNLVRCIQ